MREVAAYRGPSSRALPRGASLATLQLGLVWLFGFVLPVMKIFDVAGTRINLSTADLLVVPILLITHKYWLRGGNLVFWLFALWIVNLFSWALALDKLTLIIFLRECFKIATCYIYAIIGLGLGREARTRDALVRGMVFSAIPIALVTMLTFFTRRPAYFFDGVRVAGTFGDANAPGIYLGMVTPLMGFVRFAWLALPLFIGATVMTFSRSGLVALATAVVLNLTRLKPRQSITAIIACAFFGMAIYGITFNTTKVGRRIADYQGSLGERQGLWSLALQITAEYPLLGVGRGNWEAVSGSRVLPHNTFLSIMADTGLLGFAIFLLPVLAWLARGARGANTRPWAIAVFVGLVGGLAVSLDNFRPFWMAVGVLVAQLAPTTSSRQPPAQPRPL
jgi:O-antigen ligase